MTFIHYIIPYTFYNMQYNCIVVAQISLKNQIRPYAKEVKTIKRKVHSAKKYYKFSQLPEISV